MCLLFGKEGSCILVLIFDLLTCMVVVGVVLCSGDGESEDDDGEMDVETPKKGDQISQALEVAKALGKASKVTESGTKFDDITDGLRELDMEHYDDEEDGISILSLFS